MTAVDLRKLIYQAVFGCDHLLRRRDQFAEGLQCEWEHLPAVDPDPREAIQGIDPEGRTARIHLATCRAIRVPLDELTCALVSQPLKRGNRKNFDALSSRLVRLAVHGAIPFSADELIEAFSMDGPVHHSGGYGFASYRVVHDVRAPSWDKACRRWGLIP
jgi:hypothetical protein